MELTSDRSALIDRELDELERAPGSAPVAFFYCSRNAMEPERSNPYDILRSVARQLCGEDVSKPMSEHLRHAHEVVGSPNPGEARLPLSSTTKLILDLLGDNPATILLDGLDECDGETRHELFHALDDIVAGSQNVVKVFLTSRNDGDITCRLASTPNIHINANVNYPDIRRFISTELDRAIERKLMLRGRVSEDLRRRIHDSLNAGANGM